MQEQWNNLPRLQCSPRVRRFAAVGVLITAIIPSACSNGDSSVKNIMTSHTMSLQSDGWYANSPQDGLMVNIRYDEGYAGGSVEAKLCEGRRGFVTVYAHELKGDTHDPRDVVAESRSIPTGSATDNGGCWDTHPDTYFGKDNQVEIFVGQGASPQQTFQQMEVYDVTRDAQGTFAVKDTGEKAIDPSKIDTTYAAP